MPQSTRAVRFAFLLTSLTVAGFAPSVAQAQSGYLFDPPRVTLGVRVGAGGPIANDDLFKFFTSELTLNRSDFRGTAWAADMAFRAAPNADLAVGFAYDKSNNHSEMAKWLDQNDNPITQTTRLRRSSLTGSARLYLMNRGRAVGHHAYVPTSVNPYVVAGAGVMFYQLEQYGSFVRSSDQQIITGDLFSDGSSVSFHGGAGVDWWLTSHLGLTAEGRYAWAKATLDHDFAAYNKIDLSGFQVTTGLSVRF